MIFIKNAVISIKEGVKFPGLVPKLLTKALSTNVPEIVMKKNAIRKQMNNLLLDDKIL